MPTIELTDEQHRETVLLIKNAIDREYQRAIRNYLFRDEPIESWEYVSLMAGAMAKFSNVEGLTDALS
jgi:hypothetical protein